MLTLDLGEFGFELKDGAIKHVGPSNRAATAKLYDVEDVEARAFGDKRVKLRLADEDGNELEAALFPEDAIEVAEAIESLREEGTVFE